MSDRNVDFHSVTTGTINDGCQASDKNVDFHSVTTGTINGGCQTSYKDVDFHSVTTSTINGGCQASDKNVDFQRRSHAPSHPAYPSLLPGSRATGPIYGAPYRPRKMA